MDLFKLPSFLWSRLNEFIARSKGNFSSMGLTGMKRPKIEEEPSEIAPLVILCWF
jgi:hypothetical protein